MSTTFTVSLYLADRRYGGPEEGGWYYDCGEFIRLVRTFRNGDDAYDYCQRLDGKLKNTLNRGRRSKSSVLSNGVYEAAVHEGCPPQRYPETRPYYE